MAGNPLFANEASRVGVLCPEQGYWPFARPRSVGGLFRTFGRHVQGTCSQTLRRRVVQPHIQEGLRLGARASGAFRETVRLRTSAWRSGVGERQVIGLNADVCHQASVRLCTCGNGMAGPTRVIIMAFSTDSGAPQPGFHLRDGRQAHLPHQSLRRSSACSCRWRQF